MPSARFQGLWHLESACYFLNQVPNLMIVQRADLA